MADYRGLSYFGFFAAGVVVGGLVALMLAPTSGTETRKYVSRKAEDGRDYLLTKGKDLRKQAEDAFEKGKGMASRLAH
jgi:gas vesicle protein